MKRVIGLIVMLLVPVMAFSGPKAVKDFAGSKQGYAPALEVTRDTGSVAIPVSDILNGNVWDRMMGTVNVPDMVSGVSDTSAGNIDTFIMVLKMTAPYRTDTLRVDTVFPGDSGIIKYDFYRQDQTLDTLKDSSGVVFASVYYENVDWLSLGLDQLVMDFVWADSTGSVDTSHTGTFQYWFRFFDED